MIRPPLATAGLFLLSALLSGTNAFAADACRDFTKLTALPGDFKTISRSALGPAEMEIKSNGKCTCNDLPAVQRSLGQAASDGVNWACDAAEADDSKGR